MASGTVIQTPGWRAVFNDKDEEKQDEENATLPKSGQRRRSAILNKSHTGKANQPQTTI